MPNFMLNLAMGTHTGIVRSHNEDAVGYHYPTEYDTLSDKGVLFLLADGVGGLPQGEKASHYTIERLIELYYAAPRAMTTSEALVSSIEQINAEVFRDFQEHSATTLIAAVVKQSEVTTAYVGDSRLYWFDGKSLDLYTRDHVIEIRDERNRRKKRLTRAIGHQATIEVDILTDRITTGQGLLLVSDGVAPYLNSEDLLTLMRENPREIVADIITYSLQGGGHDNISAILVSVGEDLPDATALRKHIQSLTTQGVSVYVSDSILDRPDALKRERLRWRLFLIIIVVLIATIATLLIYINNANQQRFADITQIPAAATLDMSAGEPTLELSSNLLTAGRLVVFEAVAVTYTQIGSVTSSFLIVPETQYQVISTRIDENEQVWYQIYDEEADRSGWIVETDLPTYTTSD